MVYKRYKMGRLISKEKMIDSCYTIKKKQKIDFYISEDCTKFGVQLDNMIRCVDNKFWLCREIIVPVAYYLINNNFVDRYLKRVNPINQQESDVYLKLVESEAFNAIGMTCYFLDARHFGYYILVKESRILYLCDPFYMEEIIYELLEVNDYRRILMRMNCSCNNAEDDIYIDNKKFIERGIVVLFAGSGDSDEDGNMGIFRPGILKKISSVICEFNLSVVRWKTLYSYEEDWLANTVELYVKRISKIIRRYHPAHVYFVGHSQGCLFAALVSKKIKIDGAIMLCAQMMQPQEFLIAQRDSGYFRKSENIQFERLFEFIKKRDRNSFNKMMCFDEKERNRLWELLTLDIKHIYRNLGYQIKFVYAENDIQVGIKNYEIAKQMFLEKDVILVKGINHFLQKGEKGSMASYSECYKDLDTNIKKIIYRLIEEMRNE